MSAEPLTLNPLAAVLCDMDGLLINSEPEWLAVEEEIAAELGFSWEERDQAYCLGGPLAKVGEYMAVRAGLSEPAGHEIELKIVSRMVDRVGAGVGTMPGATELLRVLKQAEIPLALVSASPRRLVDAALAGSGVSGFDTIVAGDEVSRTKPFPDPYLTAAARLGVLATDCIVLEDSATGVAAGLASGAFVVAVPHLVPIEPSERLSVSKSLADITLEYLIACLNE